MAYYRGKFYPPKPGEENKKKSKWNPAWKKSKTVPGSLYRPIANPDSAQQAIFDHVCNTDRSLIVEAYAGCGKTSTCVETMYRLPIGVRKDIGYIIFAKRNQEEAVGKCPPEVSCKTAHAFGLNAISRAFGKIDVDKEKDDRIAVALVGADDKQAELRYMLVRGMSLAKDYLAENEEQVIAACEKHGIEFCDLPEKDFASKILEGMEVSAKQPCIVSFADMVWLPIKLNLTVPTFKYLFLDELQDLNLARIELAFRAVGNGKLIGVGDGQQAIFAFSGADRFAMQKMRERANADILPLHKTYRCGKAIVEYAKQFVPDYEAAEMNQEGLVASVSKEKMLDRNGAGAGDFVLSRINAPLVSMAMQFLKENRKCNIQGNDLGNNLLFMIKRSKATNVASFQAWLEDWKNAEVERLNAKKRDYAHIIDKAACLEAFCEGESNIEFVKEKINILFDKDEDDRTKEANRITLSTIHKAKGLERDRVWLLTDSFVVKAKTEEDKEQENNIMYVGCTRAKNELYLVE
ncbi:MAG: ATP-dependent helicase [Candidatus Micrarchaeota archaeon]|nr:ATP-dependent helicase [Candidatus Micrarchaeota archaeon]